MLYYDIWISGPESVPGKVGDRRSVWIQVKRVRDLQNHGTKPAGVLVWPVASGLRLGWKTMEIWKEYAVRCCRGWNAVLLARDLLDCGEEVPLWLLPAKLDGRKEWRLAGELRYLFGFSAPTLSLQHPGSPIPEVCPHTDDPDGCQIIR